MELQIIARIRCDFNEKFGIPRQSGLVGTRAKIIFEPPYRNADALKGLSDFSHLWLIWQFSKAQREGWSPTVRPPRLGGNARMGVFATRSPYRPNALGLSSVRLLEIIPQSPEGPILIIEGADLLDGTPIFDIKPYLAYTDSHPEALGGFADTKKQGPLKAECAPALLEKVRPAEREILLSLLEQDPRPAYQEDPARIYSMDYGPYSLQFKVEGQVLTVLSIEKRV